MAAKKSGGFMTNGTTYIQRYQTDPDVLNRLDRIEKLLEYFILKETDPERAALIVAELYGTKEAYTKGT